jgi:1-deoxy-D-xylulose-5-phosphate reductoisomerase
LPVDRLDLAKLGSLQFEAPDELRFPALRLAREVMDTGGLAGAVFNAAKESALDLFIEGKIGFTEMAEIVERVLTQMSPDLGHVDAQITLDMVYQADAEARARVLSLQATA